MRSYPAVLAVVLALVSPAMAAVVLVEAESFQDKGGWVVDQQFIDQMGSPFLMAHGSGEIVKPARTVVTFANPGNYRVFVRTRDWVAPHGPGRFRLTVDGQRLQTVFGVNIGDKWSWQDGGTVAIRNTSAEIVLEDLTGFNGRCDAIVFTSDAAFTPPNGRDELASFRKKALGLPDNPPDAGEFDVVVVGGGVAGTCATISAARLGLKVALVQNRPVLGGNSSSEVRVHPEGKLNQPPFPRLGDIVAEVAVYKGMNAEPAENYFDQNKTDVVGREKNISLFLNTHAFKVEKTGQAISAVVVKNILDSRELRFRGRIFVDCTGDATIGYLAGADYRMGRESRDQTGESLAPLQPDAMTLGTSNMWYARKLPEPSTFPECPWALKFTSETCYKETRGDWDWESGMNRNTIEDAELIRDHNLRAIYGNWSYLKNNSSEYDSWKLDWVAHIAGKRESRRLLGDLIISQIDMEQKRHYPDACVTTGWHIDLHYPTVKSKRDFPGQEFRSMVGPAVKVDNYPVPYRCFYSRNVPNLMMAGRNISVTHVAFGAVRVQKTTGMMGVVVGRAAYLCRKHDATPREVYQRHLDELKELLNQPGSYRLPLDQQN